MKGTRLCDKEVEINYPCLDWLWQKKTQKSNFQFQLKNKQNYKSRRGSSPRNVQLAGLFFRTDQKVNVHCAENVIPESFFFLKEKRWWRLRRTTFQNIWPMEPNFSVHNGLHRRKKINHWSKWSAFFHIPLKHITTHPGTMCTAAITYELLMLAFICFPDQIFWYDCILLCMKFFHLSA